MATVEKEVGLEDFGPDFDAVFAHEVEVALPAGADDVTDRLRMDYLLEKIAGEEAEIRRVAEFTTRRMEMVRVHGETEIMRHRSHVEWLRSRIRMHLPSTGDALEKAHGKKSLALPHGTVGYRSTGESIAVLDPAKALLWAKANGLPITTRESIGKKPLHEYVTSTGDAPDPELCGFAVEPGIETFYAKPRSES